MELAVHLFPAYYGGSCVYKVNSHIFQAKRFNRRAFCAYCSDRIWDKGSTVTTAARK